MQKNLMITALALLYLALCCTSVWAQVDPRDSVILESKAVAPSANPPDAAVLMGVWITNKDTISEFKLPLDETSLSGGAYLFLSYPRTFTGVVNPQTITLQWLTDLTSNQYDGVSPDRFTLIGDYNPGDLTTAEPPNAVRKLFWQIKFDTVTVSGPSGQVLFDSVRNNPSDRIEFRDLSGTRVQVHFLNSVFTITASDVREIHTGIVPREYALSQNYPNPFNANTRIVFALPEAGRATLEAFNLLGQKVGTLVDEYLSAGTKIVSWNGRDNRGAPVPSGVYFYQLRAGGFKETKKMLVLK
ncbi:MAG: T9SS type A sorting domain-containing protein [candidate division Zixibacteria bacterium]|nr:T9SS type A sorting domain-containing protein [candidate division Zixibacteria bacterium]